jgi:hypothetical protein
MIPGISGQLSLGAPTASSAYSGSKTGGNTVTFNADDKMDIFKGIAIGLGVSIIVWLIRGK